MVMTEGIDARKRWLALVVLCLGELMIVLDTTIVNVALPSIREDLAFTETSLVWVVNAYMLTYAASCCSAGASVTSSDSAGFSWSASRCSRWLRSSAGWRTRRACSWRRGRCRAWEAPSCRRSRSPSS